MKEVVTDRNNTSVPAKTEILPCWVDCVLFTLFGFSVISLQAVLLVTYTHQAFKQNTFLDFFDFTTP